MEARKCPACGASIPNGTDTCEYCKTVVEQKPFFPFNQEGQKVGMQINTSGGAFIGGKVVTNGRDFVSGNKVIAIAGNGNVVTAIPNSNQDSVVTISGNGNVVGNNQVNLSKDGQTITVVNGVVYINGRRVN